MTGCSLATSFRGGSDIVLRLWMKTTFAQNSFNRFAEAHTLRKKMNSLLRSPRLTTLEIYQFTASAELVVSRVALLDPP
jgi:hypothetical protein